MLFNLTPIDEPEHQMPQQRGIVINESVKHMLPAGSINEVLEMVIHGATVHWMTKGDWSMHDLLLGVLLITGPADVYLSSYAFSEYPARLLADLKNEKAMIRDLHCLIDSRIDKRSASALRLVENNATRCKLINTHAKVTLVINTSWQVAIVGSANYTENKRVEAGFIVEGPEVVGFHKQWMENEFKND